MNKIVLATLGVVAIAGSAWAQTPPAKPDEKTLSDAYTYLLGRVLVVRQEHMDRRGDTVAYNAIKYNPPGSADFVNPNFDVAYFEAWFAVDDRTPILLEIPEIKDRYSTAQILDEWGEVLSTSTSGHFPRNRTANSRWSSPVSGHDSNRCCPHRIAFQQGQDAWPRGDQGRSRGCRSASTTV